MNKTKSANASIYNIHTRFMINGRHWHLELKTMVIFITVMNIQLGLSIMRILNYIKAGGNHVKWQLNPSQSSCWKNDSRKAFFPQQQQQQQQFSQNENAKRKE